EEEADLAADRQVERGDRERHREAEGRDLVAQFVTLLPEGASLAHTATVRPSSGSSSEPRRSTACSSTDRGRGSSSSVTARSWKRRAATSTRDSREPTV